MVLVDNYDSFTYNLSQVRHHKPSILKARELPARKFLVWWASKS